MTSIVTSFNEVVSYIEKNLTGKIDYDEMGKIVGYSTYHLQRLFLMLSNTPISEYIRCRRLACSAHDLLDEKNSVTDIAYKYGYSSPTSFNRAFKAFHGITPKNIRKNEQFIKAYPPLSFELSIKGAVSMDYKIVNTDSFRIMGKTIKTTMENGKSYKEIPAFWQELQKNTDIPELLSYMNQQPFGLLGVSDYNPNLDKSSFNYYVGISTDCEIKKDYAELVIPKTTWATFKCQGGTTEELQEFQRKMIFDWLPTSGYEFSVGPDIEVYGQDNSVEMWIPVSRISV